MKIFDKIYKKINKKKLNYFQINEKLVQEIIIEIQERVKEIIIPNLPDGEKISYISKSISTTPVAIENEFFLTNTPKNFNEFCDSDSNEKNNDNIKDEKYFEKIFLPNDFGLGENESIIFNNQNTFENFLYFEKKNSLSNPYINNNDDINKLNEINKILFDNKYYDFPINNDKNQFIMKNYTTTDEVFLDFLNI